MCCNVQCVILQVFIADVDSKNVFFFQMALVITNSWLVGFLTSSTDTMQRGIKKTYTVNISIEEKDSIQ